MSLQDKSQQLEKNIPAKDAEGEFPALEIRKAKAPAKAKAAAGGGNSNDTGSKILEIEACVSISEILEPVSANAANAADTAKAAKKADKKAARAAETPEQRIIRKAAEKAAREERNSAKTVEQKEAKNAEKAEKAEKKAEKASEKAARKAALLAAAGSNDSAAPAAASTPAAAAAAVASDADRILASISHIPSSLSAKEASGVQSSRVSGMVSFVSVVAPRPVSEEAVELFTQLTQQVREKKAEMQANDLEKQAAKLEKDRQAAAKLQTELYQGAFSKWNPQMEKLNSVRKSVQQRFDANAVILTDDAIKQARANPELTASGNVLKICNDLTKAMSDIDKLIAKHLKTKPLSPEEQELRQKQTFAVQQNAKSEADEETRIVQINKFNGSLEKFMNLQKSNTDGRPNLCYTFGKTCQCAMTGQGTSVSRICYDGMDPYIFLEMSATSGTTFTPIFRIDGGNVSLVPKWKGLFPPYDSSKASKDETTLTNGEYYNRCVMVAAFKFWNHAKTILTQKNNSRDKPLTMHQLMLNAANFSDSHKFKTQHEFVSQQAKLFREKQEMAKHEASASVKTFPVSSNSFAALTEETCAVINVPFARCGGGPAKASRVPPALGGGGSAEASEVPSARCGSGPVEEVPSARDGDGAAENVLCTRNTQKKTSGPSCQIVPVSEARPQKDVTQAPTTDQANQLRTYLTKIGSQFGGLSTATESFTNDTAAWSGERRPIMFILSDCGVKTSAESVFRYLKEHAFLGQHEISIKKSNSGSKMVLPVLDKDGNVVQKESKSVDAATGGA